MYRCLRHNICFYGLDKAVKYLKRDAPQVVNKRTKKVDLEKLSQFCRQSEFVGAKLNYLRGLDNLTNLLPANDNEDVGTNVKIVHSVQCF